MIWNVPQQARMKDLEGIMTILIYINGVSIACIIISDQIIYSVLCHVIHHYIVILRGQYTDTCKSCIIPSLVYIHNTLPHHSHS